MSGRHAYPEDMSPRPSAFRVTVITGLVLAITGALGLLIYLAVAGDDVEFWSELWLVWVAIFVKCTVRRKPRDVFWPWAAAGQVLLATDNLASSLAAKHVWLANQAHILTPVSNYTRWAAFACSGIAIVLGAKSGELLWTRSKSRSRSGPGPRSGPPQADAE